MTSKQDTERLVEVETTQRFHTAEIDEINESLRSLDKKVGDILLQLKGSSGFWHGILFTFSLLGSIIGAGLTLFVDRIYHH